MTEFESVISAKKANRARELIMQAHALYIQAGVPTDIVKAMEPHMKAAITNFKAKHLGQPIETPPEQALTHMITLGEFGGQPEIGNRLIKLFQKHELL